MVKPLFYKSSCSSPQNGKEYTDFPYTYSLPQHMHIFPKSGTFVTTDKPALTLYNHSKSIIYIRFHFWCCTFHEFEQMYPWLWYLSYRTVLWSYKPSVPHLFIPALPKPLFSPARHWHFCHSSKAMASFPSQRLCICISLFLKWSHLRFPPALYVSQIFLSYCFRYFIQVPGSFP